jgi:hypothetical protein
LKKKYGLVTDKGLPSTKISEIIKK